MTDDKERAFHQRNNPHKTFWVIGEIVHVNNKNYIIGYIRPMKKSARLHIRLDRTFEESIWIFVPHERLETVMENTEEPTISRATLREEIRRRKDDWKRHNQHRVAQFLKPQTFHDYWGERLELERMALSAAEDYSKEGSLSEQDVSRWAADFARRYQAGEIE